jgi:hypothetical protein
MKNMSMEESLKDLLKNAGTLQGDTDFDDIIEYVYALETKVGELGDKYEQEGICGYIHGKENPENHCKHVLWAKQYKQEVDDLQKQLADMRCCGNCKHGIEGWSNYYCARTIDKLSVNIKDSCEHWQSDTLTKEEREK